MSEKEEFLKMAEKYDFDIESFRDMNKSYKMNHIILRVAKIIFTFTLYIAVGKMIIANLPPIYSMVLVGSATVGIIATIMKAIETYRVNKYMEKEYMKFMDHMDSKGFTSSDFSDILKGKRRD